MAHNKHWRTQHIKLRATGHIVELLRATFWHSVSTHLQQLNRMSRVLQLDSAFRSAGAFVHPVLVAAFDRSVSSIFLCVYIHAYILLFINFSFLPHTHTPNTPQSTTPSAPRTTLRHPCPDTPLRWLSKATWTPATGAAVMVEGKCC